MIERYTRPQLAALWSDRRRYEVWLRGELHPLCRGARYRSAMDSSPSDLVFPAPDGKLYRKQTQLELVLRRSMRRAGLVTGYVHKCRRKGCGHQEPGPDATIRHCPRCNFRMFPVGEVRKHPLPPPPPYDRF